MKKRPEESVHVCLESPIDKRRTVLQATIDTMQLMKRYENLLRIRREKDAGYAEFRTILNSINRMIRDVRLKELPLEYEEARHIKKLRTQSVMTPVVKKVETVLATPATVQEKQAKKKETKPKVSSFDAELDALQRKLRTL